VILYALASPQFCTLSFCLATPRSYGLTLGAWPLPRAATGQPDSRFDPLTACLRGPRNVLGFIWPAYACFKALEAKQQDAIRDWCTYWCAMQAPACRQRPAPMHTASALFRGVPRELLPRRLMLAIFTTAERMVLDWLVFWCGAARPARTAPHTPVGQRSSLQLYTPFITLAGTAASAQGSCLASNA
jgi:hypothetical protein